MAKKKNNNTNILIGLVVVALLVGGYFMFIKPSEPTQEVVQEKGEYDTFAQCLYESGMRMYGSVTCSVCNRQRKAFGASFEHVHEVECDPRNPNSETERCIAKDITHTPTWILEDNEGNDITRLSSGFKNLETLSDVSGCELTKDPI